MNRPLSQAYADRDAVHTLYRRLTNDGVDVWLDKEKLLPGQNWELEIKKAVCETDVVVVCLSNHFNQRGFRQKEVRLALETAMEIPEGEIFIIPARLEECDNLESLRKWHWVDLFSEDGYELIKRALKVRADKLKIAFQQSIFSSDNKQSITRGELLSLRKFSNSEVKRLPFLHNNSRYIERFAIEGHIGRGGGLMFI